MKSTVKKKTKYGTVNIPKDAFEDGQFRMTMWIDLDTLHEIRKLASKAGMGYQPWLNKKLKEVFLGKSSDPITQLMKRVEALEKKAG